MGVLGVWNKVLDPRLVLQQTIICISCLGKQWLFSIITVDSYDSLYLHDMKTLHFGHEIIWTIKCYSELELIEKIDTFNLFR